jgi:DNA-binding FadR family transcriptional regulator
VAADVAFHLTIAESAHNALFGHLLASVLRLLHEHVRAALQRDVGQSWKPVGN